MSLEHSPAKAKLAFSIREFCEAHSLGRTFVYGEIKSGRLEALKAGSRTIITIEARKKWLDRLAREAAQVEEAA